MYNCIGIENRENEGLEKLAAAKIKEITTELQGQADTIGQAKSKDVFDPVQRVKSGFLRFKTDKYEYVTFIFPLPYFWNRYFHKFFCYVIVFLDDSDFSISAKLVFITLLHLFLYSCTTTTIFIVELSKKYKKKIDFLNWIRFYLIRKRNF